MKLLPIDWSEPATKDFWQGLLLGVAMGALFGAFVTAAGAIALSA